MTEIGRSQPAANDKPWRRLLVRMAVSLGLGYGMILLAMMFLENQLIYPAPRYPRGDWQPVGLDHEDVYFESADGTQLHGWYVSPPEPQAFVLYCHGNGEHVAAQAGRLRQLRDGCDVAVFAFDYRGYGRSEGSPFERGVLEDGVAARDWLAQRAGIAPQEVVLMGRSLGGAVAIHLAESGARGLVVESTFTALPDVAARLYWWLPVRLLMRTRFDSLSRITAYQGPLLQSHGSADQLIPLAMGRSLFDAATTGEKQFLVFPGDNHNDLPPQEYWEQQLPEFLGGLE